MEAHFLNLPNEVLLNELFPKLPLQSLSNLCQTRTKLRNIWLDDNLWKILICKDYSSYVHQKPEDMLWYEYYRYLSTLIHQIPVSLRIGTYREIIGNIDLYPTSTARSLVDDVLKLDRLKGYSTYTHQMFFYHKNSVIGFPICENDKYSNIVAINVEKITICIP